ncbi:hypothetical protein B296_00016815 [Ensete ventricosum]|uniref:Uncharacterized protein n=1 Tax=Ensete ventricosum TaxID=4639 RepID=A0A427A0R4_ENSVE|nr:hypothetical protein B296_00016815 [Ensete ventricosum]
MRGGKGSDYLLLEVEERHELGEWGEGKGVGGGSWLRLTRSIGGSHLLARHRVSAGLGPRFRVRVGASIARIPRPRHRDDAVVEGQGGGEAVPAPRRNPLVPFPASRGFRCRSAGAAGDAA